MRGMIGAGAVMVAAGLLGCAGSEPRREPGKRSATERPAAATVAATAPAPDTGRPTARADDADRSDRVRTSVRAPFDRVGFTHVAEGIERVVAHATELEKDALDADARRLGPSETTALAGAISPHDDYVYAQQVDVHVYPYIHAHDVILIGVAHHARDFPDCENRLIFDAYEAWHGPYADVPISPLRAELIDRLSAEDCIVSNEIQAGEHSVEALVPFLQHRQRGVRILPILVPYMSWERLVELADRTATALGDLLETRGWRLGDDVTVLISSDSVHYGDRGWGGKTFADFGANGEAYDRAVARDLSLIGGHLSGQVTDARLAGFFERVLAADPHEYRIPWCGRFSIPFGLALLRRLSDRQERPPLEGILLRYGTTLDPGRSDPGVPGLGVTAPANLHHWVAFCAIAYR